MRYLPFILGFAGCFLPLERYNLNGEPFSSSVAGNYSHWGVLFVLIILAGWSAYQHFRQKSVSRILKGIIGLYIAGFAIFNAWQTLNLFPRSSNSSLAEKINASATPGEGLLLLAIAGFWFISKALRPGNP